MHGERLGAVDSDFPFPKHARAHAHTRSFQVRSSISLIHKCLAKELVAIFVKREENDWGRHDATESLFSRIQEP